MSNLNPNYNNIIFHTKDSEGNGIVINKSFTPRRNDEYSKDYVNRWVVSYADFITMLLALFMVLYAVARIDNNKFTGFQREMQKTFISKDVTNYQENNQPLDITKIQVNTHPLDITKIQTDKAQYSELEKILSENLSKEQSVKLFRSDKGVIIRVNNKVLFDEGSAIIRPEATKTLNGIVNVLTKFNNPVIIEGHTDSTPIKTSKYPSNWELSTARATNIISYIVKRGSVSPKRLSAVGYGEYMPISDNSSINGRILNRRVDIIVLENKKLEMKNGETGTSKGY